MPVEQYNVQFGLNGLGTDLYVHIIHEMKDPVDAISFLLTTTHIQGTLSSSLIRWGVSPLVGQLYSLQAVPTPKIETVF